MSWCQVWGVRVWKHSPWALGVAPGEDCCLPDIVQMHIETLEAVYRESERLTPIQKVRGAGRGGPGAWAGS